MNARQRLHSRVQNPHARIQQATPTNFPVVSTHQALTTRTRSDTLSAVANYHARQGNILIANRLRRVAAELKAVA